jgi:poly-gamma-glutamate synthesis protein (capsule biosynthesis protein)
MDDRRGFSDLAFSIVVAICAVALVVSGVFVVRHWSFGSSEPSLPSPATSTASATDPVRYPTLVAVGDVMLGRYVETLADLYGPEYSFEKISSTLAGADAVMGNLEGVINKEHVHAQSHTFAFSFPETSAAVLAENHFSILALGNNHAYDFGAAGFAETEQALRAQALVPVGNPDSVSEEFSHVMTIAGKTFSFASLNALSPQFSTSDAAGLVRGLKQKNPSAFTVVFVHWGTEYELSEDASQRALAHDLVDAGADLVLGGHPHVVQGIEVYRNRLIFYSLGNFIFDQYFSSGTQQGLMVKVGVADSGFAIQLVPLASVRSQPAPMPEGEAGTWLAGLAARSDPAIADQIGKGTLTITIRPVPK